MANRFYGVNNEPGKFRMEDIVTGTSTQSTDVEVRIDTGKSWNRQMVKVALEAIIRRLDSGYDDLGVI